MVIKAVIFDLDGTLIDFNIDYKRIRGEARNFLTSQGIPSCIFSRNESIFEMLKKTKIYMRNNGESDEKFEAVRRKVFEIAEKHELEAARTTQLLPGVAETLKILKKMNLKMGISTINSRKSADYALKRFGIAHFFNAVATRDDVPEVKPSPLHVETVLKTLGVKPSEALMVGDWSGDMKMANEVGLIAVGLPTGFATVKQLIEAGANYIITSLIDLPTLIQQINRTK